MLTNWQTETIEAEDDAFIIFESNYLLTSLNVNCNVMEFDMISKLGTCRLQVMNNKTIVMEVGWKSSVAVAEGSASNSLKFSIQNRFIHALRLRQQLHR